MFILTACVLPAAAETKRLPQLTPTAFHSIVSVIRDLQQCCSFVIYRGCELGSAPCLTFNFSAGCVYFKGVGCPHRLKCRRQWKHGRLMRKKTNTSPVNNIGEMTDRETLNQHNVFPGISPLVNHNDVSRSVDINCSRSQHSALPQRYY